MFKRRRRFLPGINLETEAAPAAGVDQLDQRFAVYPELVGNLQPVMSDSNMRCHQRIVHQLRILATTNFPEVPSLGSLPFP